MLRDTYIAHASHHYVIKTAILCAIATGIWSGIKTSHMPGSTSDVDAVGVGVKTPLYAMKTVAFGIDKEANAMMNPNNSTGGKVAIGAGEVVSGALLSPFIVLPGIGSVFGGGVGGLIGNHHHSTSSGAAPTKEPDRPTIPGIPVLPDSAPKPKS